MLKLPAFNSFAKFSTGNIYIYPISDFQILNKINKSVIIYIKSSQILLNSHKECLDIQNNCKHSKINILGNTGNVSGLTTI